jgi:hypothetical protein
LRIGKNERLGTLLQQIDHGSKSKSGAYVPNEGGTSVIEQGEKNANQFSLSPPCVDISSFIKSS